MRVFDETGAEWLLAAHIATGAEGAVFRVVGRPEWCVKIYHQRPLSTERLAKLEVLRALPAGVRACVALPQNRVSEEVGSNRWCGVLMPFVDGHGIYELYNPQGRREHFTHATFEFLVSAALNLSRVFDVLHEHSIIVGDISEQNIRIRSDSTLTLIDADSFQLTSKGRVFASNVGTPVWTPPELQGKSLAGVARSRNHDRFGLAQLIFLLLCGGRYPFSGRPLANCELSLEEAIADYAFAFDPAPVKPRFAPPEGAPNLGALPADFMQLFLRAFRRGSEQVDARPSPREWAEALGRLSRELARCPALENHVYWNGAKHCPWCDVLARVGFDLFPGPPVMGEKVCWETASSSNVATVVKRLRGLKLEPLHLSAPGETFLRKRLGESGAGRPDWWISVTKRMGAVGSFLRSAPRRSILFELEEARRSVAAFGQRAAKLYLRYASLLSALEKRASSMLADFEEASSWPARASQKLQFRQRDEARKLYLEGFLIRRFEIQGLTPERKASLLSLNIVTAADVTLEAVRAVPGLPEQLAQRLVRWRTDCERGFREPAPRRNPSTAVAESAESARQRSMMLCQQGLGCLKQWDAIFGEYAKEHRLLQSEYSEAVVNLALLEANLRRFD